MSEEWPYKLPPLPADGKNRADARGYLRACCSVHGSQALLARLAACHPQEINAAIKGRGVPPARVIAGLVRLLGLPAAWWGVPEPATRQQAQDALAGLLLNEPHSGWLAARLGVTRADLGKLITGEAWPDAELAGRIAGLTGVGAEAWGV